MRPSDNPLRVLSLGAGVQSTALLLMAVRGEFGVVPDAAVFADTQSEPESVYLHLDWLEREVGGIVPITRVTAGNLGRRILSSLNESGSYHVGQAPFYVREENEVNPDAGGMLRRKCTQMFKLRPLRREMRRLMAEHGAKRAEQWIGISLDEALRMKDSGVRHILNVYPLVDRRLTRHDCLLWLERNGYPEPPKSACYFCPYTSNARWRLMKEQDPETFAEAVRFDHQLRGGLLPGCTGRAYVHRSFIPLDQVDFRTAEDHGQGSLFAGFGAECEGMCGV
jgi:3'-phosphoadenosine 5'-phosphosulfate sulfotransferase (PAPS reductase)/FAD synthetase